MTRDGWRHALAHFDHRCAYCGAEEKHLTVDHFVPLALGGSNRDANVVPACRACNAAKADHHPTAWCAADVYERVVGFLVSVEGESTLVDIVAAYEQNGRAIRGHIRCSERRDWHRWFRASLTERGLDSEGLAHSLGIGRREMRGYWFGRLVPPERIRQRIEAALATGQEMTG